MSLETFHFAVASLYLIKFLVSHRLSQKTNTWGKHWINISALSVICVMISNSVSQLHGGRIMVKITWIRSRRQLASWGGTRNRAGNARTSSFFSSSSMLNCKINTKATFYFEHKWQVLFYFTIKYCWSIKTVKKLNLSSFLVSL